MPAEVSSMKSEITFQGDKQGRWCIMFNRILLDNCPEELANDYPKLTMHLHHVTEVTAKEFIEFLEYRRRRIRARDKFSNSPILD